MLTIFTPVLHKLLLSTEAPVFLTYGRKKWDMFHGGTKFHHKFNNTKWGKFIDDNNMQEGDGVVLEFFRVQC